MLQQRIGQSLRAVAQRQPVRATSRSSRTFIPPLIRTTPVATSQWARIRWYSETTEKKDETETAASEEKTSAQPEPTAEDGLQKELETKKREAIDLTDRLKRSVAEYRNLQDQTKREVSAAREFALQRFAKDLLDTVDNLDRALETVPKDKLTGDNQDLLNLHSGLKMTEDILMTTLKKHGLERFDPSAGGDKFDPSRHEAVFQAPMKDKEDGAVFHTQQKGFLYNGRVLRAAKVGVAKNS